MLGNVVLKEGRKRPQLILQDAQAVKGKAQLAWCSLRSRCFERVHMVNER